MGAFVICRLSFVEIAGHGDSTTVEITHKNNVFLICFILNGVSFLLQKISWEGIRHLLSFLYREKLVPFVFVIFAFFLLKNLFGWALLSFGVLLLSKSPCMGTQPLWKLLLKITYF